VAKTLGRDVVADLRQKRELIGARQRIHPLAGIPFIEVRQRAFDRIGSRNIERSDPRQHQLVAAAFARAAKSIERQDVRGPFDSGLSTVGPRGGQGRLCIDIRAEPFRPSPRRRAQRPFAEIRGGSGIIARFYARRDFRTVDATLFSIAPKIAP
jgi:hypothetical protein